MSKYLTLLEQGKEAIDDYNRVVEDQVVKALLSSRLTAERELAKLYATLGGNLNLDEAKKYMRLENMIKEIDRAFLIAIKKTAKLTEDAGVHNYVEAFNRTFYAYESAYGAVSFGIIPVQAIRESVFSEATGADFSVRYGKLYTTSKQDLAETITRNIALGKGYRQASEDIKDKFDGITSNALRVLVTESNRNFNTGMLFTVDRAKELGIDGKLVWLATRDGRTRPDHAKLNGTSPDSKGYFHIGSDKAKAPGLFTEPQNVIWCRCSTYFKVDAAEGAGIKDWDYDEWVAEFGAGKRYKLLHI